ncbi:Protoheme IX farnesyltransferase, mitochondrial [Cytospora mali]|uniref:Protoheme IX farnesyltransferase, mitochondrial n=1 Tax=Cytospora mali TaxID=578113 RepID=A0A194UVQ1_CYTMA|nr:Protoheme IX farnesyltransferase, mitochondrial [Valsa mali var. pyri (nom. inval.)]
MRRPIVLPARLLSTSQNLCWQCSSRANLSRNLNITVRAKRAFASTPLSRAAASISPPPPPPPSPTSTSSSYFSPNVLLDRSNVFHRGVAVRKPVVSSSASTPANPTSPSKQDSSHGPTLVDEELPPHRRRQAARRAAAAAAAAAAEAETTSSSSPSSSNDPAGLPQNASDILTNVAAAQPAHSLRRQLSALLSLSKPRLTVLVVLTAMVPYALYPVPSFLSAGLAETPSLSPLTLLFLTTGTTLCSASANALNMLYEPATDAKMSRTRNRPLVRNLLSSRAAVLFAMGCGAVGTAALYWGVNPTVAFLGAANVVLYAGIYTPMKRMHWLNTWVGALVGGIPPLMGWAAAAGESATGDGSWKELLFKFGGDGTSSAGGWLLAALLFAWQFPHFMALSWSVREEYKNAGLKMLSWVNPARNARVALRYSLVFIPICLGLCAYGITEWAYAVTSLPVNLWLVREAIKFHRHEGHKGTARGLFWASVWHLPVVMGLALLQKKGMWQRVWMSIVGEPVEDDDEWEYVEDEVDAVPVPASVPLKGHPAQDGDVVNRDQS